MIRDFSSVPVLIRRKRSHTEQRSNGDSRRMTARAVAAAEGRGNFCVRLRFPVAPCEPVSSALSVRIAVKTALSTRYMDLKRALHQR